LMMSLWDALRMNMMISYQELVRTFPKKNSADCIDSAAVKSWRYVPSGGNLHQSNIRAVKR
ncbi:hypothetical protein SJZ66_08930, partial [Klebsiella pneumoniae]|uniref:hypothetical protein n=1 Tax=Klebsiella pneumoniae TaxID=573 RepID=UPI0029D5068F